ncbi:MAG: hypothetical protein L0Z48_06015, partial [candidate division Zixibacteria bacterium]|nr:hypothetical protein [candidate division Zixibacteria bacterium]
MYRGALGAGEITLAQAEALADHHRAVAAWASSPLDPPMLPAPCVSVRAIRLAEVLPLTVSCWSVPFPLSKPKGRREEGREDFCD